MRRYLIIASLIVLIGLIGYAVWDVATFHVSSTRPTGTSGYSDPVVVSFNRPLDTNIQANFKISPYVAGTISVSGKTITFTPQTSYVLNQKYQVTISQPRAADGTTTSDVSFAFTAHYQDFTDQSKQVQQKQIDQTDKISQDNTILQSIPYQNSDFRIDYVLNSANPPQPIITVTLYGILNNANQEAQYEAELKQYNTEAMAFLAAHGAPLGKYSLTITPNPNNGTGSLQYDVGKTTPNATDATD